MTSAFSRDLALIRKLARQVRPYWGRLAALLLLDGLAVPLALLAPFPLLLAVDHALGAKPLPPWIDAVLPNAVTGSWTALLALAGGLIVLIAMLNQGQKVLSAILRAYVGAKLVLDFRALLFSHVQRLSFAYHDSKGTADSIYRIQYDADAVQWLAIYGTSPLVSAALTLAGMIYITALIDPLLALVAISVTPALAVLLARYGPRFRAGSKESKETDSRAMSVVQEVLTAMRVVKAFGQEEREQDRYLAQAEKGVRINLGLVRDQSAFSALVGLVIAAGSAAGLFLGASRVHAGQLTLGELLVVIAYLTQIFGPLEAASRQLALIPRSLVSLERSLGLLDQAPDVEDRADARPLDRATGAIEMRDVTFGYDPATPVLRDIHCTIPAGARVGLMGRTGAGKSTLVNLLTRFYDPHAGQILIDGVDLRDLRLADLRRQFAIVLQEPVLFSTSVAENIAYGRPGASRAEIVEAAGAANAHDFIEALPAGYDTMVGERGMLLSGGERQRIALARAFLRDAPILILDEPTSAVDVKTEAGILDAMERLMAGRTTIVIAHRQSTLVRCDRLLLLAHGNLREASLQEGHAHAGVSKSGVAP